MDAKKTHILHDYTHTSPLISCRFDPSGKFVFVGAEDFKVWCFQISDGKKTSLDVNAWVRGIDFANAGQTVVTGGYDGRLFWAPVSGEKLEPLRTIEAHDGWIRAVAANADGSMIASAGNDLIVRLWNAKDGKLIRELKGHESHIYSAAFHPGGKHLVTSDLHCNLIDWDLETGKQARTWKAKSLTVFDKTFVATIGGIRSMAFSPDGKKLSCSGITNVTNAFAGVGNPSAVVYGWDSGKQLVEHLSKGKLRGVAWGVAMHPDGATIATVGGSGGHLLFWKTNEVEDYFTMKLPGSARDLDLSPDGLHLATAHFDKHIRIHRMAAKT
jgi:WD40 repeat protein